MTGNLFDSPQSGKAPSSGWLIAHCDGGSRGNPGPSGYGAVLEDESGQIVARLSQFLGIQTNNYAEYSGLLAVLQWAHEHGRSRLRVISDSELMVKQMKGIYKVSSPGLRPLWEEAKKLARQLEKFEMSHTLRGGNKEADRLANEAMDRGMGKNRDQETGARDQAGSRLQALGSTPAPIRANAYEKPPARPGQTSQAQKPPRQTLEGYVKGGVVHIIEGELPEGIFVKIIRE